MQSVPVVVGLGGVNAAGRTAFNFGYQRLVYEALDDAAKQETLLSLAMLTNRLSYSDQGYADEEGPVALEQWLRDNEQSLLDSSLIREIEAEHFDYKNVDTVQNCRAQIASPITFEMSKRELPAVVPDNWNIEELDPKRVKVVVEGELQMAVPDKKRLPVSSAGQVPSGFDPASLYTSRHHPRGLQMTIFGAGEALASMGIDWSQIEKTVSPDDLAVYASSAMSQLDEAGGGGLMTARFKGQRVTSKQCPLSLVQMPADFINAYLIGGAGATGAMVGACATFLYNLQLAVDAIKEGRKRIAIVGSAEAPLNPSVLEGYIAMSALATDDQLSKLDDGVLDQRKASRPFGDNVGFTIAEGAQFAVVCADDLALELGLPIRAAVTDVFVNADGYKKSISAPGVGNYITMAKAVASAVATFGEDVVTERSFVQAHGSSTPQNRVTESHIFSEVAKTYGISDWPVTAVKSYLGHTLGTASGDQLVTTIGAFEHRLLPRINNTKAVADDVYTDGLSFALEHTKLKSGEQLAFLNAKGFGGNNATAVVANRDSALKLIAELRGEMAIEAWQAKATSLELQQLALKDKMLKGEWVPEYRFDFNVMDPTDVALSTSSLQLQSLPSITLSKV